MGCCMSLKIHFLHSYLKSLCMVSNKGERFQHDIQLIEGCYRGFWNETIAECFTLTIQI